MVLLSSFKFMVCSRTSAHSESEQKLNYELFKFILSSVTVKEIIEEQKRLEIKLVLEVLKSAEKQQEIKSNHRQLNLIINCRDLVSKS
jgi:hypothetical protein